MSCIVYEWNIDVTDDIPENKFKWHRISNDSESDALWDAAHTTGSKTLLLTNEDVVSTSRFTCIVDL